MLPTKAHSWNWKWKTWSGEEFGISEGIVVDTHCKRLTKRFGLTKLDDPTKIEKELMEIVPKEDWNIYGHLLVYHGRAYCKARKPNCDECILVYDCPKVGI